MKMERFSETAKFIISILYGAVNVGTNLAAAFGLSETIYAFLCFGCGVVHFGLCVYLVTNLVKYCERFCTLLLPIMISARYFWIGLRQRDDAQ